MPEHTRGPWQRHGSHIYGPDPSRIVICQILNLGGHERYDEDALLIISAPDLLFSIKELLLALPLKRDWLDPDIERLARFAVAKAEGKEVAAP